MLIGAPETGRSKGKEKGLEAQENYEVEEGRIRKPVTNR
jgi:hypothetical protein